MSHTLQYHTDLSLLWWTFSLISPNEDFLSVILVVIPDVNTYLLLIVSISKVTAHHIGADIFFDVPSLSRHIFRRVTLT